MPPGTLREFGFVVGVAPGRPTGLGRMRCENDTWLFTAMGMAGHEPPNELAGMCAFAEAFAPAHALAAVRAAQPMGEVARHRLASSQWRQYDRVLEQFAPGLENGYARLTVVEGDDSFFAYSVLNDGSAPSTGTSDGSYVSMVVSQ